MASLSQGFFRSLSCAAGLACRSARRYRRAVPVAGISVRACSVPSVIAMPAVRRPARMRHASNEVGRSGARCFVQRHLAFAISSLFALRHRLRRPCVLRCCLLMPHVLLSSCIHHHMYAVVKVRKRKPGTSGLVSSQCVPDGRISTYVSLCLTSWASGIGLGTQSNHNHTQTDCQRRHT